MKKLTIILFLGLLVYNSVGFIINFHYVLAEWRQEMRVFLNGHINKNDLVCFNFKKTEFDTSTHEFSKDNKRFDVFKIEFSGENIIVYCIQDDKEMQLAGEFNDLLLHNTNSKGDFNKRIKAIFKNLLNEYVYENSFSLHIPPSVKCLQKRVLNYKTPFFPALHFDILTPPPQQVG